MALGLARQAFMTKLLAFIAGMLCAHQCASLPALSYLAALALLAVLAWRRRYLGVAAFLFGLVWTLGFASLRLADALPHELEGRDVWVEGVVDSLPEQQGDGLRFEFRILKALAPADAQLPKRARLSWHKAQAAPQAGERWRLRVRLKQPHGSLNPGGMDMEQWLYAHDLRATGYVREDSANQRLAEASGFSMQALRQALQRRIAAALQGAAMTGVVQALVIGTDDAISPEQWDTLKRTGTLHLIAISGAHISLVAGLVFWLAQAAWARWGTPRVSPPAAAALAALAAAGGYAALAGFSLPTQRAWVMIAVVMPGLIQQRNLAPAYSLGVALLAVSLYDPTAVLAPGFWLSVCAVGLIILALSYRIKRHPPEPPAWPGPPWLAAFRRVCLAGQQRMAHEAETLWRVNWHVFIGLTPLTLFFFQQFSWLSPLANLIAAPVIGLLLTPLCLLGALLLVLWPPAGAWLLQQAAQGLESFWPLLEQLAAFSRMPLLDFWLPPSTLASLAQFTGLRSFHPAPPSWTLCFALPGVIWLLLPKGMPARWLGAVLLLPALTVHPETPAMGSFRLHLLDVGQGLASVAQTHSHVLVFDAGPRYPGGFDMGAAVVAPFLHQAGVEKIDSLIISHSDNDHIGGAEALIAAFPIAQAYSSAPARLSLPYARLCQAGQAWEWDGVRFEMLSPIVRLGSDNNDSCVLKITAAQGAVLLTADIERPAEALLAERSPGKLAADVLIAPHHGSNTSSSEAFLDLVKPRYIFIPAGYLNRFHHPHPKTLERYRRSGALIFNTAEQGAIEYSSDGALPSTYRQSHGKYWNAQARR
jgi:competence protein ComEC